MKNFYSNILDSLWSQQETEHNLSSQQALALSEWRRVQEYLHGRLAGAELQEFKREVKANPSLAQLLAEETALYDAVNTPQNSVTHDDTLGSPASFKKLLQRIGKEDALTTTNPSKSGANTSQADTRDSIWQLVGRATYKTLTQPISRSISVLAISATIGVSLADELHEPIYRTLNGADTANTLDWEQYFSSGQVIRITFNADTSTDTITELLARENLKILVSLNSTNQVLVASSHAQSSELSNEQWKRLIAHPSIEALKRIDQTTW